MVVQSTGEREREREREVKLTETSVKFAKIMKCSNKTTEPVKDNDDKDTNTDGQHVVNIEKKNGKGINKKSCPPRKKITLL